MTVIIQSSFSERREFMLDSWEAKVNTTVELLYHFIALALKLW